MRIALVLATLLFAATHCTAQDFSSSVISSFGELNTRIDHAVASPLPQAPSPKTDYGIDTAYINYFGELAATPGAQAIHTTGMAGMTLGMYKTGRDGRIGSAPAFELGVVGPLSGGYPLDGFLSVNVTSAARLRRHDLFPNFTAGYTRFFATGDAINFGLGIDIAKPKEEETLMRIELRDYYLFDGPRQHVVGLRFAFGKLISD